MAPSDDGTPIPVLPVAAGGGGLLLLLAILGVSLGTFVCCCRRRREGSFSPGSNPKAAQTFERNSSVRISGRRGNKPMDPVAEYLQNYRTEALEAHPPIPVAGFVNKLLVMRTNDNQLFLEEFGSIEMTPQQPCSVAELPANRGKNRYNNILTYDHSRVKLSHNRGQQDYINASYCSGFMKVQGFIATQGPLSQTVDDFWRLAWEQNTRTIVMLTNTHERGKAKCEVYWPREVGCSVVHGTVEVTLSDITQLADYTIRSFSLHKAGSSKEAREVRQFHFTSWPDHGVPQYATAMLSMLRRVQAYHGTDTSPSPSPSPNPSPSPMLIHCSAGVGRTGTFIVIYSMLERLKARRESVDIYGHVSLLRTQRNYMVQTEDQYFFIYEAVAEAIVCGNTEVSLERLAEYVIDLLSVTDDQTDNTNIELQFKRLAVDKSDPYRFASANRDVNKSKNRYVNVLPYENTRVTLQYQRAQEGSDYINASFIDGYHYRNMFIATQGPLQNTMADFWRMVWECSVPVIVMLTKCHEKWTERSAQYWPQEMGQALSCGSYSLEMTVERKSEHYTYRDFQLTDSLTGRKRQIRHFHFLAWPEVGVPSSSMVLIDFLREVQKNYSTLNTHSPIIVHCSNGIGRSGVFIALHIILERMVAEGLVDVFQTIKNLRIQRPAMVQTLEQYQFCYNASLDYLESSDLINQLRSSTRSDTRSTRTASNASELRNSRRSPARSDSVRSAAKRSSRNLELAHVGNGVSTVYGGSEATSTFSASQYLQVATMGHSQDSASPSQTTFQGAGEGGGGTTVPSFHPSPLPPSASPSFYPRHLLTNPRLAHLDISAGAPGSQPQLSSGHGSNPYLPGKGSTPQLHAGAASYSLSQGHNQPSPSDGGPYHTSTLPSFHSRQTAGSGTGKPPSGQGGAYASQGSLSQGSHAHSTAAYPVSSFGVSSTSAVSQDSLEHSMAALTLNLNNSNNSNVVDVYVET